jgi:hypothetical protein
LVVSLRNISSSYFEGVFSPNSADLHIFAQTLSSGRTAISLLVGECFFSFQAPSYQVLSLINRVNQSPNTSSSSVYLALFHFPSRSKTKFLMDFLIWNYCNCQQSSLSQIKGVFSASKSSVWEGILYTGMIEWSDIASRDDCV